MIRQTGGKKLAQRSSHHDLRAATMAGKTGLEPAHSRQACAVGALKAIPDEVGSRVS